MRRRWLARLRRWTSGPPVAWAVFIVGLLLTGFVAWRLETQVRHQARAAFEADLARLDQATLRYLEAEVELLRAAQGLFDAGPVDGATWKAFVARFDLRGRYPGIRSLGYLQRVEGGDLETYEAQRRRELGLAVNLEAPEAGWGFYPHFIEPMVRDPRRDMAWNIYREPLRRSALRRAIEADAPSATPLLHLVGLDDPRDRFRPAVVVYLPVYRRPGTPPPAERWRQCRGVVFTSIMLHQVFEPLTSAYPHLALRIQDADDGNRELYRRGEFPLGQAPFQRTVHHQVAQRTWTFTYQLAVAPGQLVGCGEARLFLVLGFLVSGGSAALTWALLAGKRRAERLAADLRRSEGGFRRLTEQAPCGILQFQGGLITYANPFARTWLGCDPAFQSWRDLVHPEDLARLERRAWEATQELTDDVPEAPPPSPAPRSLEVRLLAKGEPRWVALTLGGQQGSGLATFFDLTGRVAAEDERLDAERRKAEARRLESLSSFAAGLAHGFNNLLGIILGRSDLAAQADPEVQRACLRAAELTRQLLAFAGTGPSPFGRLDLGALVQRFHTERAARLPEGVRSPLDLKPCGPVPGQVEALVDVLAELWENALEALGEAGGEIRLSLEPVTLETEALRAFRDGEHLPPGPYVRLTVEDTGRGMEADQVDRVFDPFFSTKFLGRGLGLSAVAGVVKGHGGGLRVESQPGRGTRFELVLPEHSGWVGEETVPGLTQARSGRTILVVDDEPALRELARQALGLVGLETLEAPGGRRALELLEEREDIGLLVLDMAMPDLNGAEVLKAIRGRYPGLRVILSSGYTEERLRESLEPGDVAAFLPKPYRIGRLQELAQGLLG